MKLFALEELPLARDNQVEFKGYNHNLFVPANEFYDMKNLSSSCYPVLSPRRKRGFIRTFRTPNGLTAKDELAWVDGENFYYNGAYYGKVANSRKQFVSMGAYLLIWPDKLMFDTVKGELKPLGAAFSTVGNTYFRICKEDGTEYTGYATSDTAPASPADGALWLDTSKTPPSLKQFSAGSGAWNAIATTYVKIGSPGLGRNFKQYDGVTISGVTVDAQFNTDTILWGVSDDYIVVTGILSRELMQETPVTVQRKIPDMEFLTESENRVWGCNSEKHEIYACKLGDPTNWNCFMGIASDSFALTIGSDGDFTGACTHLGYVLFFKEDTIHRLYGTKPANFQLVSSNARGVERGSEKSLVTVNETLYYKSRNGVCAYDGSLPVDISAPLGPARYRNAVAGTVGNRYYISMEDADGGRNLFVYDEALSMWHREDNLHPLWFARRAGELYYVDAADNALHSVNGTTSLYNASDEEAKLESEVEWMAETGDLGALKPDRKYVSRLQFRLSIPPGARFKIELQTDSSGAWEEKAALSGMSKNTFTLPVLTPRCDHLKIRLSGTGDVKVYAVSKIMEQGSEV